MFEAFWPISLASVGSRTVEPLAGASATQRSMRSPAALIVKAAIRPSNVPAFVIAPKSTPTTK